MKKLLFITALLAVVFCKAQETDQQKVMSILTMSLENVGNYPKLDSLIAEAEKMKASKDIAVKMTIDDAIYTLKQLRNSEYTSRSIKVNFEDLDKDLKKGFKTEEDKFKKMQFISLRGAAYMVIPYLSVKNNLVTMRLRTRYSGTEWLFFDKVIFNIDNKNYEYDAGKTSREVHSGGSVVEWSDIVVDNEILDILKTAAYSQNNVEYRFTGQDSMDYKLSESNKKAIAKVLEVYYAMTK